MSVLSTNGFVSWSATHISALALILALSGMALLGFRHRMGERSRRWTRWSMAAIIAALVVAAPLRRVIWLDERWQDAVPLHLCDVSLIMSALALLTRRQFLFEFAYFFGIGGTLQALFTPDLALDFPSFDYVAFFAGHGAILIAVAFLIGACGMRPARGAVGRMIVAGNAYLMIAGFYNILAETNFGYLRQKPAQASLLDHLGPWPWYLLSMQALAILNISLLALPFWWKDRHRERSSHSSV